MAKIVKESLFGFQSTDQLKKSNELQKEYIRATVIINSDGEIELSDKSVIPKEVLNQFIIEYLDITNPDLEANYLIGLEKTSFTNYKLSTTEGPIDVDYFELEELSQG